MATQGSSVRFSGKASTAAWTATSASNNGTSKSYDLFVNQTGAAATALTAYVGDASGEANKIDVDEGQKIANCVFAQLYEHLGSTNYDNKVSKITIRIDMTT